MKNLLKCSSLIGVAVFIVVMVFMASQVTDTYAHGTSGGGAPATIEEINGKLDEINNKLDCVAPCPDPAECPGAVPKTGQINSFGNRDDGDLELGVAWPNPRFTDNGNGTITDNLTYLIWDKDANRFGGSDWSTALSNCNGLADNGEDLTDDSEPGDWQLANRSELISLHTMNASSPAVPDTVGNGQWSQGDPFNNVLSSSYWTSNTRVSSTTSKWFVSMASGRAFTENEDENNVTWCVRGEQ